MRIRRYSEQRAQHQAKKYGWEPQRVILTITLLIINSRWGRVPKKLGLLVGENFGAALCAIARVAHHRPHRAALAICFVTKVARGWTRHCATGVGDRVCGTAGHPACIVPACAHHGKSANQSVCHSHTVAALCAVATKRRCIHRSSNIALRLEPASAVRSAKTIIYSNSRCVNFASSAREGDRWKYSRLDLEPDHLGVDVDRYKSACDRVHSAPARAARRNVYLRGIAERTSRSSRRHGARARGFSGFSGRFSG